jgi:hypothetical protein
LIFCAAAAARATAAQKIIVLPLAARKNLYIRLAIRLVMMSREQRLATPFPLSAVYIPAIITPTQSHYVECNQHDK